MNLSIQELRELIRAVFQNNGFTEEETSVCTDEVVDAHCRGKTSHGASIVPEVIDWHTTGTQPSVQNETTTSAFIDGNETVGPLVAKQAMDIAMTKADKNEIGIVGVDNKTPFITAGYNVRRAATNGYVGLDWCAAAPKVAVWGSKTPVIGTNPFAIGVPADDFPIVFDIAMTKIAATEIRRADRLGNDLPNDVALSPRGSVTTDPAEAIAGTMLPFGRHKGSGLGIMIDLLGGALVGGKRTGAISGTMTFIAIKPDVFRSRSVVMDAIKSFVETVHEAEPRSEAGEVLLPGERGERNLKEARENGVVINDTIHEELIQIAN